MIVWRLRNSSDTGFGCQRFLPLYSDAAQYAGQGRLDDSLIYPANFDAENLKMVSKLRIYLPSRTAVVLQRV